jgi:phage-related protein
MQELLAKRGYDKLPVSKQEFYELRVKDSEDIWNRGIYLVLSHARWSQIDRHFMWSETVSEKLPTLEKAKERYEDLRRSVVEMGFTESDMDF